MSIVMTERMLRGLSPLGFHRIAYVEWGLQSAPRMAVCVHGLTRNSRDFDDLAIALADSGWRVACPDMAGRGRSDRLTNPDLYGMPQYLADVTALIARLDVDRLDWVGTSMGGLIGMMLAALPGSPIRRLVLNDVGPAIPKAALEAIANYVGKDPWFADEAAAEAYLRAVHAGFGPLDDAQWRKVLHRSVAADARGGFRLTYDPAIAVPIQRQPAADVALWSTWDAIACPVMVVRGADSGLLTAETVAEMSRRGPALSHGLTVLEVAGAGHAPSLMPADQIAAVRSFLEG